MSTTPVTPTSSAGALAVVEVLTARALDALGGQSTLMPSPPSAEAATPAAPQTPPAITAATLQAASQQGGAAPLFADLAAVVQSPGLPQPVVVAARQVLALVTPLDPPPSAADLKAALGQSGLLLEAHIAAGEGPASDLKAALLNLQQTLQTVIDEAPAPAPAPAPASMSSSSSSPPPAPSEPPATTMLAAPAAAPEAPVEFAAQPPTAAEPQVALLATLVESEPSAPVPVPFDTAPAALAAYAANATQASPSAVTRPGTASPPFPEGPTRAQAPAQAALAAGATQAVTTHRLLEDTTAALARQVLFQLASAPATQRVGDPDNAHWLFELPLATAQGTAVAQFEIDRDGGGGAPNQGGDEAPSWRARFSLDLGDMGPVHAQVSLGGGRAGVSLWAEKPETAQALRAGRSSLADDFKADAVDAEVAVFLGQPPAPTPRAGRILDQAL